MANADLERLLEEQVLWDAGDDGASSSKGTDKGGSYSKGKGKGKDKSKSKSKDKGKSKGKSLSGWMERAAALMVAVRPLISTHAPPHAEIWFAFETAPKEAP